MLKNQKVLASPALVHVFSENSKQIGVSKERSPRIYLLLAS